MHGLLTSGCHSSLKCFSLASSHLRDLASDVTLEVSDGPWNPTPLNPKGLKVNRPIPNKVAIDRVVS